MVETPTGLWYEELAAFSPDEVISFPDVAVVTEEDNYIFADITHNKQPIHIDKAFVREHTKEGKLVVNGILTQGIVVGMTVEALTAGTIVANLEYDNVKTPAKVFVGDEIFVAAQITGHKETSNPKTGIIYMRLYGMKMEGKEVVEVMSLDRTVLSLRKPV
jgi:acyl dehydratase